MRERASGRGTSRDCKCVYVSEVGQGRAACPCVYPEAHECVEAGQDGVEEYSVPR